MDPNLLPPHMSNSLIRRGIHPSLLAQQSPLISDISQGSPNFDPSLQQPSAPAMPDKSPASLIASPAGAPPAAVAKDKYTPKNEAEIIVNALIKRLSTLGQKEALTGGVTPTGDLSNGQQQQPNSA